MRVTIKSDKLTVKSGTGKKSGQPYEIREQDAYLHTGRDYPEHFPISLDKGQGAYPPGEYTLLNPVTPGKFGLEVSRRLNLVPFTGKAA